MTAKTTARPTFEKVVTMYGAERTITATNTTGSRRGARYLIAVDGETVGFAHYLGGRRYIVGDANDQGGWEYVTNSDGGKVADVAEYVAYGAIHEQSDAPAPRPTIRIESLSTLGYALSETYDVTEQVVANVVTQTALEPVRCIDCETYVPFGWVEYGTVKCAENIGASGVQYGHRIHRDGYQNVLDVAFNKVASDPTVRERVQA